MSYLANLVKGCPLFLEIVGQYIGVAAPVDITPDLTLVPILVTGIASLKYASFNFPSEPLTLSLVEYTERTVFNIVSRPQFIHVDCVR